MGLQEPQVEPYAVPHHRVGADEFFQPVPNIREGRCPSYVLGGDTGVAPHEVRNLTARIDEGLKGVQHLVATETHRTDLEYGV